jgi:anaerobic magnesium-protoporphyrin IX monomethyl ester cyclase
MTEATKILFVVPMHITFGSFIEPSANSRVFKKKSGKSFNSLSTDLPIGPMSLSAYLKRHVSVDVELVDFNAEMNALDDFNYESFKDFIFDYFQDMDFKPDVVGISSLFSPSFDNFMDCGEVAKEIWPDSFVIGGGNIPTNSFHDIYKKLDCDFFDALCYGEGEKPLLKMLQSDDYGKFVASSNSWITKAKVADGSFFVPSHDFIEDLDEIPFLDYDLCDLSKHGINQNLSSFHNVKNPRGFHIMTSRGCPYLCTFCASHRTHGRSMRYYSMERVSQDLRRLVSDYQADTVVFQDDHLMADPKRVYSILEIVGELKLNSLYQNGLTLYALDRPMLEAFYKAGVRHLVLPVESGSEKVLKKQMKKPLKMRISERVADDCRDLGIYTNVNIMVGMPGETVEDLNESRLNLRNVHGNWFNIACASPLVGSDMHQLASENGYINEHAIGADYHLATITTEDWTSDFIQSFQYKMNIELNFVYNNDIRSGNWEWGLQGFQSVIRLRFDHAFAHYYAFLCLFKLGRNEEANDSLERYLKFKNTEFWQSYVEEYQLPDSKSEALMRAKNFKPSLVTKKTHAAASV